ncbi:hypothetical protein D9O40_00845 [Clostridium autoethanogenum]|uniref:SbsA Ig-like domain-containing protein n=1 Tax=Clostridium autoethanogenum TaxID=84023 RepID=A0A3M0TCG5_9CLOT|nr:hypothetical protein [Clostridium autoethanogenum]RMD04928.1 hypothetical protein D9O40_00845 [Clostridium autoethanogenum]
MEKIEKQSSKLILIIITFVFVIIGSKVYALQITDNRVIDKNKDWIVKFSDNICLDDLTKNAIVIKDDISGNSLDLNINLCDDGKSILISHPCGGYTPGDYTLYLGTNIHSLNDKKLKKQQILHFGVPCLPIEESNVDKVILYGKSGEKDIPKDEQVKIIELLNSIKVYDYFDYAAAFHSWAPPMSAIEVYTKNNKNNIEIRDGGSNDSICINYEYYAKQPELKQILRECCK